MASAKPCGRLDGTLCRSACMLGVYSLDNGKPSPVDRQSFAENYCAHGGTAAKFADIPSLIS